MNKQQEKIDIILAKGSPYTISGEKVDIGTITVYDGGTLTIRGESEVTADTLVRLSGDDSQTVIVATGVPGWNGEDAENGGNAIDGKKISIIIKDLQSNIVVLNTGAAGGNGGHGGHGGMGENGYANGLGAPGGNGGAGGNGGNGGAGPLVHINYGTANESKITSVIGYGKGGKGGPAGAGGRGGVSGDGETRADNGLDGAPGKKGGDSETPGETIINACWEPLNNSKAPSARINEGPLTDVNITVSNASFGYGTPGEPIPGAPPSDLLTDPTSLPIIANVNAVCVDGTYEQQMSAAANDPSFKLTPEPWFFVEVSGEIRDETTNQQLTSFTDTFNDIYSVEKVMKTAAYSKKRLAGHAITARTSYTVKKYENSDEITNETSHTDILVTGGGSPVVKSIKIEQPVYKEYKQLGSNLLLMYDRTPNPDEGTTDYYYVNVHNSDNTVKTMFPFRGTIELSPDYEVCDGLDKNQYKDEYGHPKDFPVLNFIDTVTESPVVVARYNNGGDTSPQSVDYVINTLSSRVKADTISNKITFDFGTTSGFDNWNVLIDRATYNLSRSIVLEFYAFFALNVKSRKSGTPSKINVTVQTPPEPVPQYFVSAGTNI
jgi:hypothetical protein